MLHDLIRTWFHWVQAWGYLGVFLLMALESSIVPVPSEIVMPPAAYFAAQGQMNFGLVVLAGTLGSYAGSVFSFFLARFLGLPLLQRYGKWFFLPPQKLLEAEVWVARNGASGIFFARLLPVLRHLISYPAGVFRMNFRAFSLATLSGAGIWCAVLAWFGQQVLGDEPALLESPEALVHVMKAKLGWIIVGVAVFALLYTWMKFKTRTKWEPAK